MDLIREKLSLYRKLILNILITTSIIITFALLLDGILLIYIANKSEQDTKVKSDVILVLGGTAIGGLSCPGPQTEKSKYCGRKAYFQPPAEFHGSQNKD
jgi:hypothetical protein